MWAHMRPAYLSLRRYYLTYELSQAQAVNCEGWALGQPGLFVLHIGWVTCAQVQEGPSGLLIGWLLG